MGEMLNILEEFHHQADIQITGMTAKSVTDRKCEYPPVVAALEAADLHPIHEYIQIRQNTISENVACHLIYEICNKADRRPGTSQMMRWWYQDVVHEPEE